MMCYLFIALMAFLDACKDAFENENFFESIFKHWNQHFWYKRESWKYTKKFLGYRFDAWHICKSLQVLCLIGVVNYMPEGSWWVIGLNVVIIWNAVFNLFYHGVFRIK